MKKYSKKKPLNSYCQPTVNELEKEKVGVRDYKHLSNKWMENMFSLPFDQKQYLFMLYSSQGNKKLVKLLVEDSDYNHQLNPNNPKINVNYIYQKDNALTLAARNGDMATVKYLVENGVDIDFVGADGKTALHTFAYKGMENNCQYLLDNFANVNVLGAYHQTPIFDATINNQPEVIELLSYYGANLDAQNDLGNTPLMIACQNAQRQEALLKLLKLGANLEATNKNLERPIFVAIKSNNRQFVDILLKRGCNLDCQDKDGMTPLMLAAKYGQKETLRVLISKGADINLKDNHGSTALDYAKKYNHLGSVDILQKAHKCFENGEDLTFFGKQNKIANSCVK